MKAHDPLHGDFFSFIPVYGFRHALFVRLENVFEFPAVEHRQCVTKQLNRRRLPQRQKADQDCQCKVTHHSIGQRNDELIPIPPFFSTDFFLRSRAKRGTPNSELQTPVVPRQAARRRCAPSCLLLAGMGWESFARRSPEEESGGCPCLNESRLCLSAALRPENEEVLIRKKVQLLIQREARLQKIFGHFFLR